ncbi:hypothetical protein [Gryllotalpicola sp.]|uniref:hypothetical protein n=1 Tax=Gryllotalpicola sp. TaxID=1932787 RepID=UPI00261E6B91|nr:hypothetical protein [Gryllotalpicola sp.]
MVDQALLGQVLSLDEFARRELRAVIGDSLDDGDVSPEVAVGAVSDGLPGESVVGGEVVEDALRLLGAPLRYGDPVHVLGRTGLRWGEARAMLVHDLIAVPKPMLDVVRNQPQGTAETAERGRRRAGAIPG